MLSSRRKSWWKQPETNHAVAYIIQNSQYPKLFFYLLKANLPNPFPPWAVTNRIVFSNRTFSDFFATH